ncbi:MAG TPA: UDP-glucose 4-epimerase GalE [Pyrinomonadaceae bacterium]|nr:UDP-glucose 4-epimerase GalE [Pyrinomonadaceae bacterium]
MAILVTGGAGYIGSVTVEVLETEGFDVVVVDNLSRGHREAVADHTPFYLGNIGDRDVIRRILNEHPITACMHFSAFAYVGESVEKPQMYFENNFVQTAALLDELIAGGVKQFVFSSTCATYGEPHTIPIDEMHSQNPTNPYGWSKLFVERMLSAYDNAYDLRFVALRYFNAAGATETRGERHEPETHLIPLALAAAAGEIERLSIFGDDYPTPDGTAIRDYIHVSDLAKAHVLAVSHLENGGESDFINLGNGDGYSVREVVDVVSRVVGREVPVNVEPRRAGDPSRLIADAARAKAVLGWQPEFPDLESIIESAFRWKRPPG